MKAIYFILVAGILLTGCKKANEVSGSITVTGVLKAQGTTTYQYGTHTIQNDHQFYALMSGSINLDQYVNKTVTITGSEVIGYPMEDGPMLLEVFSVK